MTQQAPPKPPSVDRFAQLWQRVNDHKVAQWSLAYIALAYAIQHGVTLTSEAFEWPNVVARSSMLLLILGLPFAITFAWYHGARASRQISQAEMSIISILLVFGSLFFYVFVHPTAPLATATRVTQEASVTAARQASASLATAISLAVMPFENLSPDPDQGYFADGIGEEITTALAKIPDLRVVARESAQEFKGKNENFRDIGKALNATHLLQGSVRKAGDRLRISVQLVRADTGATLWADSYDRQLIDVFAIQEDVARTIASSLHMTLPLRPGENLISSRTTDQQTYADYLRAKALARDRAGAPENGVSKLNDAVGILEKIVSHDPAYAPAWALLAQTYDSLLARTPAVNAALRGPVGAKEIAEAHAAVAASRAKSEAAARRAVQLDPQMAEGYLALAQLARASGKQIERMEFAEKARALDPLNPDSLNSYSTTLADLGFPKLAIPVTEQLLALEPFVPLFQQIRYRDMYAAGQYDEVIRAAPHSGEPDQAGTLYPILALAAQGRYREAADVLHSASRKTPAEAAAEELLASAGRGAIPKKLPDVLPGFFLPLYASFGAPERLIEVLEGYQKVGYFPVVLNTVLWTPSLAPMRKMQRFKDYVRGVGMVDYWKAKGWPAQCHPTTGDDFECN